MMTRIVLLGAVLLVLPPAESAPKGPCVVGVDCNYALDMARRGKGWRGQAGAAEPFALLAGAGCRGARIRLWVGDDGMNRLAYATETARRAQRAGLKPYLVIFLSEDWADFVKQPAPAVWKGLAPDRKLVAIEAYAEGVVAGRRRSVSTSGVMSEGIVGATTWMEMR